MTAALRHLKGWKFSGSGGFKPLTRLKALFGSSFVRRPCSVRRRAGVNLVELMISMSIITIGVVASMGSFKYINLAISNARLKTIATNLAQEKMEVLKNKSYFQVMVTTSHIVTTGFDQNFAYDSVNYPPEVITLWGQPAITRVVNIDYASVSGNSISTIPYSYDDPGMKKITVYVFWSDKGGNKKIQLDSYYQNPTGATLSAGFRGVVTTGGVAAKGVLVQVAGSPKWRGYSDSGGNYSFQVAPGSYSLVCSSAGFYSQVTSTDHYVAQGVYVSKNFSIVRIASGTVASSSVYAVNPGLVISQVVASTAMAGVNGYDIELIELYNPTTYTIQIGNASGNNIKIKYYGETGHSQDVNEFALNYINTSVAAKKYFLVANAFPFSVGAVSPIPDALFAASNGNLSGGHCGYTPTVPAGTLIIDCIRKNEAGAVVITDAAGTVLDAVGWDKGADTTGHCEGNCIQMGGGLQQGEQIVRFSSACAAGATYGRAYDSNDNANNFYHSGGFPYRVFYSGSAAQATISGVPALSAYVFADDGNSSAAQAYNSFASGPQGQSCPRSSFTLVGVATGTWKVTAVYGDYLSTISNVVVAQNATTSVPGAATSPAWPAAGLDYTVLSSTYAGGLASGYVYGDGPDYWLRLNGKTVGSSMGNYTTTDSQGWYLLQVPTGTVVITANYNSADGNYVTSSVDTNIAQGVVTAIPDFHIARGGYIKGYVTSGTGAIPNIPVRATNGGAVYEDITDNTGYYYIFAATSSVSYTITPELDPLQSYTSVPASPLTALLNAPGFAVPVGTITVIGALGTISGSVTDAGAPITTGVLLVASTAAVPTPLATIYASSAPAQAVFYSISSKSDGTYSLEVRSSSTTTYNLRAFYPVVNLKTGTVTYTSKTLSAISVAAGAEVTGKNFAWP